MTPRRGLLGPLILISVGVVFLLANFGFIAPLSIVALFNLWPLVLIVVGIDIAIGRRWPLAALAADVLLIAAGLALIAAQPSVPGGFFFAAGEGDPVVTVPRSDAKTLSLRLNGGAGTYTVKGGAASTDLVRTQSDRSDLHLRTASRTGDRMDVTIDQGVSGFRFGPSGAAQIETLVASDVPTSLQVDAGAGEFVLDLSDVRVTDVRVSVGAASLRVVLPRPTGDVPITISAGASSMIIEVPSDVEARITTTGGLASSRIENGRFSGNETTGYASAKDRVTVRVTAGASSVVVR